MYAGWVSKRQLTFVIPYEWEMILYLNLHSRYAIAVYCREPLGKTETL